MLCGFRGVFASICVCLCLLVPGVAGADGTEILGPPLIDIMPGTDFAVGGIGLFAYDAGDYINVDGEIAVDVPEGVAIQQVILYWLGEFYPQTGGDDTAFVNGVEVVGAPIGGPTNFFSQVWFESYRADITELGVVANGPNLVLIEGLDFSFRNTGAGILVIYDDGQGGETQLVDGLDMAYYRSEPTLDAVVPQTFWFEPSDYDRIAQLPLFVGSVGEQRSNVTEITIGDQMDTFFNLFTSQDGPEWDSVLLEVVVPAGVDQLTVNILSESDGSEDNPASFAWVVGGLSIEAAVVEPECGPCAGGVTGLTLQYNGSAPAHVKVIQPWGFQGWPIAFCGTVNPGEPFSFQGLAADGTFGPYIYMTVNGRFGGWFLTSCHRPIGPGLTSRKFEVVAGTSLEGGPLCPLDPGAYCVRARPRSLDLVYTGASCSQWDNGQPDYAAQCVEDQPGADRVWIVATDTEHPFGDCNARIWFFDQVEVGETFTIDAYNDCRLLLGRQTYFYIFDTRCRLVQIVKFNTSCWLPLHEGDQFGGLTLVGYTPWR